MPVNPLQILLICIFLNVERSEDHPAVAVGYAVGVILPYFLRCAPAAHHIVSHTKDGRAVQGLGSENGRSPAVKVTKAPLVDKAGAADNGDNSVVGNSVLFGCTCATFAIRRGTFS